MEITMTSTKKKILEEILPVRIIREVEKWPVLYMRDCPEMPNTHFKNKVWHEVAKALIEDWDSYTQAEKECKVLDLTKKWRNLRDTFKRQLLVDKKVREGQNIKKKKYVYFKHMSFLLPHEKEADEPEAAPAPRRKRARSARAGAAAERDARRVPAAHAERDAEHIDEDKHFLMSLLPSFKRMNDDEKLTAKMEILKVIKDVRKCGAAPLETYVCQLDLAAEPLAVKEELFTGDADFKCLSECSGLSETD